MTNRMFSLNTKNFASQFAHSSISSRRMGFQDKYQLGKIRTAFLGVFGGSFLFCSDIWSYYELAKICYPQEESSEIFFKPLNVSVNTGYDLESLKERFKFTLSLFKEHEIDSVLVKLAIKFLSLLSNSPQQSKQFFLALPRKLNEKVLSELIGQYYDEYSCSINSESCSKLFECLICQEVASSLDFPGVIHEALGNKLISKEMRKELLRYVLNQDLLDRSLFPGYGIHAIIFGTDPSQYIDTGEEDLLYISLYGALFYGLMIPGVLSENERNQLLSEVIFSAEWKTIRRDPESIPTDQELLKKCLEQTLSLQPNKQFFQIKEFAEFIDPTNPLILDTSNPDTIALIEALRIPQKVTFTKNESYR